MLNAARKLTEDWDRSRGYPYQPVLPVPEARSHFKCSRCGSRSITTRPQVYEKTNAQIRRAAQEAQRLVSERREKASASETVPHD